MKPITRSLRPDWPAPVPPDLLNTALVRVLDANKTRFGLTAAHLATLAQHFGFRADPAQVEHAMRVLAAPNLGLVAAVGGSSPAAWMITAKGRNHLAATAAGPCIVAYPVPVPERDRLGLKAKPGKRGSGWIRLHLDQDNTECLRSLAHCFGMTLSQLVRYALHDEARKLEQKLGLNWYSAARLSRKQCGEIASKVAAVSQSAGFYMTGEDRN